MRFAFFFWYAFIYYQNGTSNHLGQEHSDEKPSSKYFAPPGIDTRSASTLSPDHCFYRVGPVNT